MISIKYFGAAWCGPCKQVKPIIKSLDNQDSIEYIDVDSETSIAALYRVAAIPTIVYEDENKVEKRRRVGMVTKAIVLKDLEELDV